LRLASARGLTALREININSKIIISNQTITGLMLRVSDLNVFYGESHILRNVDLSVPSGEMVCLIGRNGVGKTTLLKTIMGLLSPRTGEIWLNDRLITKLTPDRR
jgi:urea transport system ATP-binding protein